MTLNALSPLPCPTASVATPAEGMVVKLTPTPKPVVAQGQSVLAGRRGVIPISPCNFGRAHRDRLDAVVPNAQVLTKSHIRHSLNVHDRRQGN